MNRTRVEEVLIEKLRDRDTQEMWALRRHKAVRDSYEGFRAANRMSDIMYGIARTENLAIMHRII